MPMVEYEIFSILMYYIFLPEVSVPGVLAQSCCTSVNSVPSPVQPNIKWS